MRTRSLAELIELARVYGTTRPQVWLQSRAALPSFTDLSEFPDDTLLPVLDRKVIDESGLSAHQHFWRAHGYLIKEGFIPEQLIDDYVRVRAKVRAPHGWQCPVPYMHVPEIRALCLYPPLMELLRELVGREMFLHLNLTGWVSTERDWHQDDYLNPSFVNGWYAAVWFALDEIHPHSGPFEFVPGSHRWPVLRGDKVRAYLTPQERTIVDGKTGMSLWPLLAERLTTPAIADMIRRSGQPVRSFLGRKGDLLIWHARLIHRGSKPRSARRSRKALIAHYSAVDHRPDMPILLSDEHGQKFARFDMPLT
jgi:Phytanoyl-CoA dioxygenase (PhyH)